MPKLVKIETKCQWIITKDPKRERLVTEDALRRMIDVGSTVVMLL